MVLTDDWHLSFAGMLERGAYIPETTGVLWLHQHIEAAYYWQGHTETHMDGDSLEQGIEEAQADAERMATAVSVKDSRSEDWRNTCFLEML